MAIFHCNISVASRADGASAVAGAAYISRSAIEFEREGTVFDFTKAHRHERLVADLGIALPDNAPKRFGERGALWNEVERVEKKADAQLCRRIEWALPDELPDGEKIKLARKHVAQRAAAGHVVDACIHCNIDGTNWHVHELEPLRPVGENGFLAKSENVYTCRKLGEKDDRKASAKEFAALKAEGWEKVYRYRIGGETRWLTPTEAAARARDELGQSADPEDVAELTRKSRQGRNPKQETRYLTDWNEPTKAEEWRSEIAALTNEALEENGFDERVDHRSYERQGIERVPQVHEGSRVRAMENRAKAEAEAAGVEYEPVTLRGAQNAERRMANAEMAEASRELDMWCRPTVMDALLRNLRELCLYAVDVAKGFRDFRERLKGWGAATAWKGRDLWVYDEGEPRAASPVADLHPKLRGYLSDNAVEVEAERVPCMRDAYIADVKRCEREYMGNVSAESRGGGYALADMPKLKLPRPAPEIADDAGVKQAIASAWQRCDTWRLSHAKDAPKPKPIPGDGSAPQQRAQRRDEQPSHERNLGMGHDR